MRLLGIIGGTGPETTVEYYRMIISRYQELQTDGSYPRMVISSINLQNMVDLINAGELAKLTDFLLQEVTRLADAKAEVALIAANTPHLVFDDLQKRSPIPLISIVEATCDAVQESGLKRVALLGTRFTMRSTFYSSVFSPRGISLVIPQADDIEWIHDKYMSELLKNIFLPETHSTLLEVIDRMRQAENIEGVLLAGTELTLILKEENYKGIPFFDTAKIHAHRAAAEILK